ncbi:RagB/SusD family nutrient uptake outer membrane protein [Prolixibacteraceae bacterium JC049]|nr:RagB/SusD family nutrient uptake outer membrane protein [Prolixibacteraceae bacterium JC049]
MKVLQKIFILTALMAGLMSCGDYLDVVPDDVATLDNAFTDRVQARKYLFTCYSYLPPAVDPGTNPAYLAGDEYWLNDNQYAYNFKGSTFDIALGSQTADDPLANFYEGRRKGWDLYQAIRNCNIFIKRVAEMDNIEEYEKAQWKAEAQVLKAYYHFFLLRMYGPIPLIKENLPVSASPSQVKFFRAPVDECFTYIVELLDEAIEHLPALVENTTEELGRITSTIAKGIKARVLLEAASPLFNGNKHMGAFVRNDGEKYFSEYDKEKWKKASDALLEAIDAAHQAGHKLYVYTDNMALSDELKLKMTLRNRVPDRWNSEVIWGDSKNSNKTGSLQDQAQANFYNGGESATQQGLSVTFNIIQEYYSNNGVPIQEDKAWSGVELLKYKKAEEEDKYNIKKGEEIPAIHFNREPRFYADLAFDRSVWMGQGRNNPDDSYIVKCRNGELSGKTTISRYNVTGYFPKKLVNVKNVFGSSRSYTSVKYAFPLIRLSDLYLAYAEALNEYAGPSDDVYSYIDQVRERAGLKGVVESWRDNSISPEKPLNQDGLRTIIQQERMLELAFEGRRYWDVRRWMRAEELFNTTVKGWDVTSKDKDDYYNLLDLYHREFEPKDYFWPIRSYILTVNPNLDQNPGWE